MKKEIVERVLILSKYIKNTNKTIRETALVFGMSKSSVHLDVSKRLRKIDFSLWKDVNKILKNNFNEKHIRGGEATKKKYLLKKI